MSGDKWIDKLADEAKRHDEELSKQKEIRVHQHDVIEQKARTLWDALVSNVERGVQKFEQDFANDKGRSLEFDKTSSDGFRIHRTDDLPIELVVHIDIPAGQIEFTQQRSQNDVSSGTLFMQVDANDNLYLTRYGRDFFDMADAARMLLEPIFTLLTTERPPLSSR